MKFWDSSALVPLIADEPATQTVIAIVATDPSLFVAFITPVEVESAIWRKAQRTKEDFARQRSQQRLAGLRAQWLIVDDFRRVLSEASRSGTVRLARCRRDSTRLCTRRPSRDIDPVRHSR